MRNRDSGAYGKSLSVAYTGVTRLENVTLTPVAIPADGASTSQAAVTILPTGQGRTVAWSIVGAALGSGVNPGTGVVTAGGTAGAVTVRATSNTHAPARTADGNLTLNAPPPP